MYASSANPAILPQRDGKTLAETSSAFLFGNQRRKKRCEACLQCPLFKERRGTITQVLMDEREIIEISIKG